MRMSFAMTSNEDNFNNKQMKWVDAYKKKIQFLRDQVPPVQKYCDINFTKVDISAGKPDKI